MSEQSDNYDSRLEALEHSMAEMSRQLLARDTEVRELRKQFDAPGRGRPHQRVDTLEQHVWGLSTRIGAVLTEQSLKHGMFEHIFVASVSGDDDASTFSEMTALANGTLVARPWTARSGPCITLGDDQAVIASFMGFEGTTPTAVYVKVGGGGGGIKRLRWKDDTHTIQSTTKSAPAEEDWVDEISFSPVCDT